MCHATMSTYDWLCRVHKDRDTAVVYQGIGFVPEQYHIKGGSPYRYDG